MIVLINCIYRAGLAAFLIGGGIGALADGESEFGEAPAIWVASNALSNAFQFGLFGAVIGAVLGVVLLTRDTAKSSPLAPRKVDLFNNEGGAR